jgi:amino acid adenylation domain-containing protein
MLPLVKLTQDEIERIVNTVPGGAANVQDIYPLVPLQEGIFFHHVMSEKGDPYLVAALVRVSNRSQLDTYLQVLQFVVNRHDILRTSVAWEGLLEPIQVVWRKAMLPVEEIELDPADGDVAEQLYERFNPRNYRMELSRAPMLRIFISEDKKTGSWLMVQMLHHLVGDNSTTQLIQSEIQAYLSGQADALPAPFPYRNLVAQSRLGVSQEEHEAFFRQMLGDVEEPTTPFGLLNQGDAASVQKAQILLDQELAGRLRQGARKLGTSAASLFHVAWARVLAQTSGHENVVFGTVVFGRMHGGAGTDQGVGLFINTLPVRIRAGQDGVESAIRLTHALLTELMQHEHTLLALAQRCSQVAAPAPLFTSLLNYRHSSQGMDHAASEAAEAWKGIEMLHGEEGTNYPLAVSVDDMGDGFLLTAELQGHVEAARVCEYMRTALESLADALENAPGTAVRNLKVMGEAERQHVLHEWNNTRVESPSERCIHELFEEQVKKTPETRAVVFGDDSLSYGELNRRANQLAHYLRGLGVKPDERVAICVERGLEMVVGVLGILKAGGAYVPLDTGYPVERLRYMLEDSEPAALLTQEHLQERFTEIDNSLPVLDLTDSAAWQGELETNPGSAGIGLTSRSLAYVIYTSGSTGMPKGVMVEHANVTNLWSGLEREIYQKCPICERVSMNASLAFDASVQQLVQMLSGRTLVIISQEIRYDAEALLKFISDCRIDALDCTPSQLNTLLTAGLLSGEGYKPGTVLVGGEAIDLKMWRAIARSAEVRFHDVYGPTECTVDSTIADVTGRQETPHIGGPIANTQIYVLDGHGEPVPEGVAGELYIAGAGVARGYMNRPELTAERFVADPFAEEGGARVYRTGDLGRWLAKGDIEFLGRNDGQVKIRGYRIELGEIEARLAECAGVREAVVLAREEAGGAKRLIGYVVAKAETELTSNELRDHLKVRLPEFMVPSSFVRLERLPLTPNGKLDRKKLPVPDDSALQSGVRFVAPRTTQEKQLAEIWEELLGKRPVGVTENFFDLGGHSILAIRLIARMERQFGKRIPVAVLFQSATVEALAQILAAADSEDWSPLVPIQPNGNNPPLFFVHAVGGQVLSYMDLSRHLAQDQPFYGLQSRHGIQGKAQHTRLEEMAAEYVEAIQAFQPVGPYRLGGWSMGGVVAFEMARQMQEQGHEVSLVALVDSYAPTTAQAEITSLERKEAQDLASFALHMGFTYQQFLGAGNRIFSLPETERVACLLAEGKSIGLFISEMTLDDLNAMLEVFNFNAKLMEQYQGGWYEGTVTLFRAETLQDGSDAENGSVPQDPQRGWEKLAAGVKAIPVPGDHLTMIQEPHVKILARELSACIATAVLTE